MTWFAFLLSFAAVASISAQSEPLPPLPTTEPLEEYGDDPVPLLMLPTTVSPGRNFVFDAFASFQVNVNSSNMNIVGDAANEPSITVDPTNPNRMSIGWRQFNSVTSNFRQGGYGFTTNGGLTWTFPGVLENNVFRSDPVLVADDTGRLFYNSLLQSFFDDIWGSLNGGQTWTKLQATGNATGGDKQWHAIDNTTSTGHGFQYQAWSTGGNNFGGRQFSRSIDGGVTWLNPVNIPNSPQWGTLDVASNGNLFIGGINTSTNVFWCIRSTNAKNGAVTPSFDLSTQVLLGGTVGFSRPINPEGLVGQVFLQVDRSGTSTNNNIYMMASLTPTGFTTGSDVMFSRSDDGGQSFTAGVRINDDPINHSKWHWLGTFSIAPNGRLDAVWMDTRNAANNTDSQLFYSFSTNGGVTWSPNVAVTPPFNPFLGYPQQNKMGDYITLVSDNTGANVAYAATFNSEEDIYYVRVAPGVAPTPTPTPVPTATATPTPIATATATPLSTATPTPVATASPTATPAPTPTPTPGPTATPGPTSTPGPSATPTPPGPTPTPTSAPTATPTPGGPPAQALNISTRMRVESGDNVAIGGFVISGPAPKTVVVRGIGPSLTSTGISDALADPTIELRASNGLLLSSNDNWQDNPAQAALLTGLGLAPANSNESALVATLQPGAYTGILAGKNQGTGVGLVEIYDTNSAGGSELANISTRGFVRTADNVMIGGFILGGTNGITRVVVRGLGPSLTQFALTPVLADPTLELRDSNGAVLVANDNWQDDPASATLLSTNGFALPDHDESGIFTSLPSGQFTAILSGKNGGIGIGLVEIYNLR